MKYEEDYHGVKIVLVQDEIIEKHPDGSLDYRLIRFMPTLDGQSNSYIRHKCGADVPVALSLDFQQTQNKISEVREDVLAKLRSYIDRAGPKRD